MLEDRIVPSNLNLSAAPSPASVAVGSPMQIVGGVSSTDAMATLSTTFSWGDGSSSTDPYTFDPTVTMTAISHAHTYTMPGSYTVTVTADAGYSGGGTDWATESYLVTVTTTVPPPPPPPPAVAAVRIISYSDATEGTTPGLFQLQRDGGDITQPLTVGYTVTGSATPILDYDALSGTVTFAANATTATISVTAHSDNLVEGNETVTVTLSAGAGYVVVTPCGIQTLLIHDDPPIVTIGPVAQTIVRGGFGTISVYRSGGDTTQPLTATVAFGVDSNSDPLATWNDDYSISATGGGSASLFSTGGTVTFDANSSQVDLEADALTNNLGTGTEGFQVAVAPADPSNPTYTPGGAGQATAANVQIPGGVRLVVADLVAKNILDANEDTVGATFVKRADGNDAPRKEVTLKAIPNWVGTVRLDLTGFTANVSVYDAADATGNQVQFDGTGNVYDNATLPKTFYVQGDHESYTMRDSQLKATPQVTQVTDVPVSDQVSFTVVWLTSNLGFSGNLSSDNSAAPAWKALTDDGSDSLGLVESTDPTGRKLWIWGYQAAGYVFPANLTSATAGQISLRMDRDAEVRFYLGNVLQPNPPTVPGSYGNAIPRGNDSSAAQYRDDDPNTTGTYGVIYDIDGPGVAKQVAPQGTIIRFRMNFREYAKVNIDNQWIRASNIQEAYIRFSIKQTAAGNGATYVVVTPPMIGAVVGDNAAGLGQTPLTWDLQ